MAEIEPERTRDKRYSYSPSPPPRGHRGRGRSPSRSPRRRYGGHDRDLPTSLLVRNLRLDCRPEDLRKPFGQFGRIRDIYLPRDYYTGEPRGFGFVQFVDPEDAADAKYKMDGQFFLGRELTVVFAEENRKKPADMRARGRVSGPTHGHRRSHHRSPSPYYGSRSRYSRSRSPRYSRYSRSPTRRSSQYRSPSPRYSRSSRRVRTPNYSPSPRSVSPLDQSPHRERRQSLSLLQTAGQGAGALLKTTKEGLKGAPHALLQAAGQGAGALLKATEEDLKCLVLALPQTAGQGPGALQKTTQEDPRVGAHQQMCRLYVDVY